MTSRSNRNQLTLQLNQSISNFVQKPRRRLETKVAQTHCIYHFATAAGMGRSKRKADGPSFDDVTIAAIGRYVMDARENRLYSRPSRLGMN